MSEPPEILLLLALIAIDSLVAGWRYFFDCIGPDWNMIRRKSSRLFLAGGTQIFEGSRLVLASLLVFVAKGKG